MRRIAITGISGYIGNHLLRRLEREEDVERIIGIDLKPPRYASQKLRFYHHDIREPFESIFADNQVDSAIHLAFVVKPTHHYAGARRINIGGIQNLLKSCQQASIERLLCLSSHTVYGPHRDNPVPLIEDSPLRPIGSFQYSWDKAEVDRMSGDFMNAHPDRYVAIVRSCVVIGPEGSGSVGTGMFRPLMMMRLLGYDPALQFVHEDDLVELMLTLLRQKQRGIFNCAGPGFLRYKEVIAATGKPSIVFPAGIMSPLLAISWWLHLQSESPPGGLEFIKYPIVLSTEKVQKATGFQFRYSSREALLSFLNARKLVRWLHYTNEAEG